MALSAIYYTTAVFMACRFLNEMAVIWRITHSSCSMAADVVVFIGPPPSIRKKCEKLKDFSAQLKCTCRLLCMAWTTTTTEFNLAVAFYVQ